MTVPASSDEGTISPHPAARRQHSAANRVELVLPVRPELWLLARMSASAIASRLDFGVDAVEDLRLAIDELCNSCALGALAESRLRLDYTWDDDAIDVACSVAPVTDHALSRDGPLDPLELSARILEALVDEHEIGDIKGGQRRGWLTIRRSPAD
ncbi:MAG TPA: hypothetical protein VMU75_09240 [Acidimicrobiales bacterium]|nr:hypothetical protein [Acidimicrobiales bacterium]